MYSGQCAAWITAGPFYAVQLKHDPANVSIVPEPDGAAGNRSAGKWAEGGRFYGKKPAWSTS